MLLRRFGTVVLFGLVFLSLTIVPNHIYSASNSLIQIRCHLYKEGGKPVRIRFALDFQDHPEKLTLLKSDEPYRNVPGDFIEDFIILDSNGKSVSLSGNVKIRYSNAADFVHIALKDQVIHLAVKEDYELTPSTFKYVTDTQVSYVDINIVRRSSRPPPSDMETPSATTSTKEMPSPTAMEQTPQTAVEKPAEIISPDTIYLEKIIHDTIFVDKIAETGKESDTNKLTSINCEHCINWWNDPHLKLNFLFNLHPEKLGIIKSTAELDSIPEGYSVQYEIYPLGDNRQLFYQKVEINYEGSEDKILLIQDENRYYLLSRDYDLQPLVFTEDDDKRVTFIRVRYEITE